MPLLLLFLLSLRVEGFVNLFEAFVGDVGVAFQKRLLTIKSDKSIIVRVMH